MRERVTRRTENRVISQSQYRVMQNRLMMKEKPYLVRQGWGLLTTMETLGIILLYGLIDKRNEEKAADESVAPYFLGQESAQKSISMRKKRRQGLEKKGSQLQQNLYKLAKVLGADVYLEEFYGCG